MEFSTSFLKKILKTVFFIFCVPAISFAGSGAFRVELPDAGALGKGSAFVGEANTPAAVYYNPAGLSQLQASQVSLGTAWLAPYVDYEGPSGAETQMRRNQFWIPHVYLGVPLTQRIVLGLGATSYFGLGTEWAEDSFAKYVATESNIENKDYMLTLAYKLSEHLGFAVSTDSDTSKANKKKKLAQTGAADGDFELNAKSTGWGYRLATMYKLNGQHQFGLMYRSTIRHKYRGKAYLDKLNSGGVNYQAIFGGTYYETELSEEFVLPQSVVLGYSFKPDPKWTFNADLEWMDWSSVEQELINWESETDATRLSVLNDGNPARRDWRSVWSFALGTEYAASDRLRLRGGYYHHQTPIPEANWEPNLPDSDSNGLTAGVGYDVIPHRMTLDLAYSALFYKDRRIDNTVGSSSGVSIDGEYSQWASMFLATVTYRF